MIIQPTTSNSIVKALEDSEYRFYLTGSRLFRGATEGDWDFFTTNCPQVESFLIHLGFEELSNNEHYPQSDNVQELVSVWRHPDGVDVQLVVGAEKKAAIQNVLTSTFVLTHAHKDDAAGIWRRAYSIFNAGMEFAYSLIGEQR